MPGTDEFALIVILNTIFKTIYSFIKNIADKFETWLLLITLDQMCEYCST